MPKARTGRIFPKESLIVSCQSDGKRFPAQSVNWQRGSGCVQCSEGIDPDRSKIK